MKRSVILSTIIFILCLCFVGNVTAANPSIKLDKKSASITVGKKLTLKATVKGSSKNIKWKSSNTKVATVKNGVVKAVNAGKCTISATANGKTAKCTITVKKNKDAEWYKTVINSNKGSFKLSEYLTYPRNSFKYYKLIDINGDGIKEMFISQRKGESPWAGNYMLLLTYYNGKVVPIGPYYRGEIHVIGHYLCTSFYVPGFSGDSMAVNKLDKGKLKMVNSVSSVGTNINGTVHMKYYDKDDKSISKKQYDDFRKKYFTSGLITCTNKMK